MRETTAASGAIETPPPMATFAGAKRVASGLRRNWRSLCLAVVLLSFCALSGLSLLELRRDTWQQATTGARNLVGVLAREIALNFETYDSVLQRVASLVGDPAIAALPPTLQRKLLFQGADVDTYFSGLIVLDRDGEIVWSRGGTPARRASLADRDYFADWKNRQDGSLLISAPFRSRSNGAAEVIALGRRIDAPDGSFAGVVVGTVRLDYFRDLFRTTHLGPDDALNIMSTEGIMLMREPEVPGVIGRDYSGTATAGRILAEDSGAFTSPSSVDGIVRVYSFQRVPDLPLVLSVALSEKSIFALWNRFAVGIGIALAVLCAIAIAVNSSMRRELRRRMKAEETSRHNESRMRLLADNTTDVIQRLNEDRIREYISPASLRLLGYPPETLIGKRGQDLIHPDDQACVDEIVANAKRQEGETEAVYRLRRADGRYIWVEGRYNYVPQDRAFVVVLRDVSRRKEAELRLAAANAELSMLARTDGLTGLANRRSFDETIEAECAPDGGPRPVSLLLLDIDRFKLFNDRYGHPAGDECLRRVAAAIRDDLKDETAFAARYGGEELAVLLPGMEAEKAGKVAERVRTAIAGCRLPHEGNQINGGVVTVSVGQATIRVEADGSGPAPADLVGAADRLLYEAKRLGRNRVVSEDSLLADALLVEGRKEAARIEAVKELLDVSSKLTPGELDNLASTAAKLFNAPIGFVSLIGEETAHMIGRHGAEVEALSREQSFCNHTIRGDDPLVVENLIGDRRFAGNPLLEGDRPFRFYAGAPLFHPQTGKAVGAVCVLDFVPRTDFNEDERRTLAALSSIATTRFAVEMPARS